MPRRRKTPQEKKVFSYQKDCRNRFGENDKASRKWIPRRKRIEVRMQRRSAKQALGTTSNISLEPDRPARRRWEKDADRPLADHLDDGYDYGREGLDERRDDKRGLRAEAKRRLKRTP